MNSTSRYGTNHWKASVRRSDRALEGLAEMGQSEVILEAHRDTDALRQFGERFRKKKGMSSPGRAQFELDKESGQIFVSIFDEQTGALQFKLTPEQVAESLKNLEETDDNEMPLSAFFVDITV